MTYFDPNLFNLSFPEKRSDAREYAHALESLPPLSTGPNWFVCSEPLTTYQGRAVYTLYQQNGTAYANKPTLRESKETQYIDWGALALEEPTPWEALIGALENHGVADPENMADNLLEYFGSSPEVVLSALENKFYSVVSDFAGFSNEHADERLDSLTADNPKGVEFMRLYFDYSAYEQTLRHDFNLFESGTQTLILTH